MKSLTLFEGVETCEFSERGSNSWCKNFKVWLPLKRVRKLLKWCLWVCAASTFKVISENTQHGHSMQTETETHEVDIIGNMEYSGGFMVFNCVLEVGRKSADQLRAAIPAVTVCVCELQALSRLLSAPPEGSQPPWQTLHTAIRSDLLQCFKSVQSRDQLRTSSRGCLRWRAGLWGPSSYTPRSPQQRNGWGRAPPPRSAPGRTSSWLSCSQVYISGYTAWPAIVSELVSEQNKKNTQQNQEKSFEFVLTVLDDLLMKETQRMLWHPKHANSHNLNLPIYTLPDQKKSPPEFK